MEDLEAVDLLHEGVFLLLFEEREGVVLHRFRERPLEVDFVATLLGEPHITIDFSELLVDIVRLEINEFILDVAHGKERPDLVPGFVDEISPGLVGVLVSEGAGGKGECIIQVHLVSDFVHF